MRISTGYQYDTYRNDISQAEARLVAAQRQVTTGRKLDKPSDDPAGTGASLSMRSLRNGIEQYQSNIDSAKGKLGYAEDALSTTSDLIKRAYALSVQGANGATTQEGRNAMVTEIGQIQARVLDLANSRGPTGEFLFAGQANDSQPYTIVAPTGITFNGDVNSTLVETGPGTTMAVNTVGEPMFSDLYKRLETLKNNLMGGNLGAISGVSIVEMQDSQKVIDAARGTVGVKLKTVADLSSQFDRRTDELTTSISDIEDIDYAEAIMKYQSAQTSYQAALTIASQGFKMSLMDFIN